MSPLLDGTGLQARVGGQDVTAHTTGLTFSAVDPGGYETCTLNLAMVDRVEKGATVAVFAGVEDVWWGRVEEPGQRMENGQVVFNVSAVGAGAALKDGPYAMIYADRDLSRWADNSVSEQLRQATLGEGSGSMQVSTDGSGAPGITQIAQGPWANGTFGCYSWYDAGPITTIGQLYFVCTVRRFEATGSNDFLVRMTDQDSLAAGTYETVQAGAQIARSGYVVPSRPYRHAVVQMFMGHSYSGSDRNEVLWQPVVYGDHGLLLRGPAPGGFYPSDIAQHALKHAGGHILPGVIETASGYIVAHSVYREPTEPEKVIDDMAKLMGWHWGVWGPDGALDGTPRLHFRSPPPEATAHVSRTTIGDLDLTDRLSDVYDSVQVAYTDAASTTGYETVEIPNPNMPDGLSRQAQAQIGLSTAGAARAFGRFWLLLSQRTVRAAGSGTLPATVSAPDGGSRRALGLKPGIDRLRITDLPSTGQNLLETDTRRFDTFRIRRAETTIQPGGAPVTRVEFDQGANLLDTLQTRLDAATQVAVGT